MAKPYRMQRIGILNHMGEIWTPHTFDSAAEAQAHLDRYQRHNPKMDLSNHRPAPVRVTLSVPKKRSAPNLPETGA
jgi:hypothetical protein